MEDNGGTATWGIIYDNIKKYYPCVTNSREWKAGIRGVLYREIREGRLFKKIGLGIFALSDYKEQLEKIPETNVARMHSFIQGVCLELGNFEDFDTFTADPSALFKDNIYLGNLSTLKELPQFTYEKIVNICKRIDVVWLNKAGYQYPKRAFEVVHSIGTLGDALNRTFQLSEFNLKFYIVGRKEHKQKFDETIVRQPYVLIRDRYEYKNYEEIVEFYRKRLEIEEMQFFK
jgi:hypothetical protein